MCFPYPKVTYCDLGHFTQLAKNYGALKLLRHRELIVLLSILDCLPLEKYY